MPNNMNSFSQSDLQKLKEQILKKLEDIKPAGDPKSPDEPKGLMLSSRTKATNLPDYYLVYFLLVDLLDYPKMGKWEKTAWTVPIRYKGRLFAFEHRKMGFGIFAPCLDPAATCNGQPTSEQETEAQEIAKLVSKAAKMAKDYFRWRAEQAVTSSEINVNNRCLELFNRYEYFKNEFINLKKEVTRQLSQIKPESLSKSIQLEKCIYLTTTAPSEINWNAQAAIEAFFSWTEHAFIHLAILQGKLKTADEIARLAGEEWGIKFRTAIDINDREMKNYYDSLLDIRTQIRNFMAHGAFGKKGEAFEFHSGAGAVPVLLSNNPNHQYAFIGNPDFDEIKAIDLIEKFIDYMWSANYAPAKLYIFSSLPSILTYAKDGTYKSLMTSEQSMEKFIANLSSKFESAANMDW